MGVDWFGWLSQQPPAMWEWIGIIVGIIAFVGFIMNIPAIFYSAPKIITDFDMEDHLDYSYLIFSIYNKPITNKFMKLLKIRRNDARGIVAVFGIQEKGTNKIIFRVSHTVLIKIESNIRSEKATLQPSPFPASFPIIAVAKKDNQVYIWDEDVPISLQVGEYIAKVDFTTEGERYIKQRGFTVQSKYPFAYWEISS